MPGGKALIDFVGLKCLVPKLDGELRKLFLLYTAFASLVLLALGTMRDWLCCLALLLAVSWKYIGSYVKSHIFLVSVRLPVSLGEH